MSHSSIRAGAVAAGVTLILGLQGCGDGPDAPPPPTRTPIEVRVASAWTSATDRAFPARLEASRTADVATRTSGVVRDLPFDVGDRVRAGQVVVRLDGDDVSARIEGAQAQVALAEQTHGRLSRLVTQGAASQQELDQATAALAAARAVLGDAQAQSGYTEVVAPFSGVVVERLADPGDLAVPGRPVLRLQGDGAPLLVADLPDDAAVGLGVGTAVRVTRGLETVPATVTRVAPALDARSRRYRVEARFDAPVAWRVGVSVTLQVAGDGGEARWIPESAVVRRGQLAGVFTVEDDTLRLRWLRLGRVVDGSVEVLAGPAGALEVVVAPGPEVADGTPVSAVQREGVR